MNSVMNERSLNSRWREVFCVAATAYRHQRSPRSTNREVTGEHPLREWFSQRVWEDDGGRIGRELTPVAR
jgi:hypothetical protein